MDPTTLLAGKAIDTAGIIGGKFLGGLTQPGGPAISSSYSGGTLSAPFNVGGGIGGAGQIGSLGSLAQYALIGLALWLLLKK